MAECTKLCDVNVQLDEALDIECVNYGSLNCLELITENKKFMTFQLSFEEQYCLLRMKEGQPFAVLNNKTFRSLKKLTCFEELSYTALFECNNEMGKCTRESNNTKLPRLCLNVNIFGPRDIGDTVARDQSGAGMFLQAPEKRSTMLPYEKPQFLLLPGILQREEPKLATRAQALNGKEHLSGHKKVLTSDENLSDFDAVFEKLPPHDYLKSVFSDFRIKTSLLR